MKAPLKRKRKPKTDQAIMDRICTEIASGRSLRSICLDDGMPCQATVYNWLKGSEAFVEQYARAREVQADTIFDEMLDIADNSTNDWMERSEEKGGGYELNGDHVQRTKLRIETRKWMAGKLRPKKYGEKIDHTVANPDGTPIVFQTIFEKKPDA